MGRLRTIRETVEILHQIDPDTPVNEFTLRKMIAEGSVPAMKSGRKNLVLVDEFLKTIGVSTDTEILKKECL